MAASPAHHDFHERGAPCHHANSLATHMAPWSADPMRHSGIGWSVNVNSAPSTRNSAGGGSMVTSIGATAGAYLATDRAMPTRSLSSNGGRHRAAFSTRRPARMPPSLMPRRRIDPAMDARSVFLCPAEMVSGIGGASGAVVRRRPPSAGLLCPATSATSHSGAGHRDISHGAHPSNHSHVPAPLRLGQTTA